MIAMMMITVMLLSLVMWRGVANLRAIVNYTYFDNVIPEQTIFCNFTLPYLSLLEGALAYMDDLGM